jgi:hypothetical protein
VGCESTELNRNWSGTTPSQAGSIGFAVALFAFFLASDYIRYLANAHGLAI